MRDINNILDNIQEYENNISDLVNILRSCGIDSFDEFKGKIRAEGIAVGRKMQLDIQKQYEGSEEDDWANACEVNTIESYGKYLEKHPEGSYVTEARNKIDYLKQQESDKESESAWESLNKKDIHALISFKEKYPNSSHHDEVSKLIAQAYGPKGIQAFLADIKNIKGTIAINAKIKEYIETSKISKNELLDAIKDDNNLFYSDTIKFLYEQGIIQVDDFPQTGIDDKFLCEVFQPSQGISLPDIRKQIAEITMGDCTEVYFWGIPSSGKTCALAAIMSTLCDGRTVRTTEFKNTCQGYEYVTKLAEIFKGDRVCILPPGTQVSNTYEMGMSVTDNERKTHPITFIDLAGELLRIMYKRDTGIGLTGDEQNALNTVTDILKGNDNRNRKIHFFVIEYGVEDRKYDELSQDSYLKAALNYIKETGIFEKDTDAIFLLITKVDIINKKGEELREELRSYIKSKYLNFYNGLENICEKNEINNGRIEIQPFSLGKVCMKRFCLFDSKYAAEVVSSIIKRSYSEGSGWIDIFRNRLKK